MIAVWIVVASVGTGIVLGLLTAVVIGIKQEPTESELSRHPQKPAAALIRRLLGVSVRRPEQDTPERESCLTGSSPIHREGSE